MVEYTYTILSKVMKNIRQLFILTLPFIAAISFVFYFSLQQQRIQQQLAATLTSMSPCGGLSYPCQEGLISFPTDEGKHPDKQVEWWYVNLNTTSASNGFSLAGVSL